MSEGKATNFVFKIQEGFDYILEEGGNTSTNLRKIAWGENGTPKIDIRKWSYQNGEERAMKGCTLTDEGANELAAVLCENNYGDTKRILKGIRNRDDFESALESVMNGNDENEDGYDTGEEEYYDPKELLG